MTLFPNYRVYDYNETYVKNNQPLYTLAEDLLYGDKKYGGIVVPTGYKTDFVSFPYFRKLWGKVGFASAIVHDYCYGTLVPRGNFSREEADNMFLRCLEKEGVSYVSRYSMYLAVKANTLKMRLFK